MTVLYLRIAAPNLPRPFKAPLGPVTPIVGAALCLLLLMTLMANPHTRDFFLRYLAIGLVLYFVYGFWFSKVGRAQKA